MDSSISVLGTRQAVFAQRVHEDAWFGLRSRTVSSEVTYQDWTVDGVLLREVLEWDTQQIALIQYALAPRECEEGYLLALLRNAVLPNWTIMPDGRVPLLVCPICFDLGCTTLTANLIVEEKTVEWRDIGWQVDYEPLDLSEQENPVISLVFERTQYEAVLNDLLDRVNAR